MGKTCAVCHATPDKMKTDKRYNEELCLTDFDSRRNEAARAGDSEWFEINGLQAEMTEEEKLLTGLY